MVGRVTQALRLAAALAVIANAALADPLTDGVVAQLRDQGFVRITVTRTWLGRILIIGYDEGGQREVVLNPNTGEVLRDYFRPKVELADSGDGDAPLVQLPERGPSNDKPQRDPRPEKPAPKPPSRPNKGGGDDDGEVGAEGGGTDVGVSGGDEEGDGDVIGDEGPGTTPPETQPQAPDKPDQPQDEIKE